MAYYFASNHVSMFDRSSALVDGVTTANTFDPNVTDSSISLPVAPIAANVIFYVGAPILLGGVTSLTSRVYGHFNTYTTATARPGANGALFFLRIRNSVGTVVFQIVPVAGASDWKCQYWNGSTFIDVGSPFQITSTGLNTWDFEFLPGSTGVFRLSLNNSSIPLVSVSNFSAAVNNFAIVDVGNPYQTLTYVSEVCLADFDTRGVKVASYRPTGNGFHTDGTGTFSDVNSVTRTDTTGIGLPASGNRKTFTKNNLIASGMVIDTAIINAATAVTGGVVTNARGLIRRAGTTVTTGNIAPAPGFGLTPRSVELSVDPTTGSRWLLADFNNSEFGLEARP